jgi:acyl-CoA synthetase (AMP-forming)/AMP-acid ligase II
MLLDSERLPVEAGQEGLLYIGGPSVFSGYWGRPNESAAAFLDRGRRLLRKAHVTADFGHLPKTRRWRPFRISMLQTPDLGILPKSIPKRTNAFLQAG